MKTTGLASMPILPMNKRQYRLAAIDLDWTTLNREKTIGARTVRAVNQALEQGTEVIFCTGRSRAQFERYLVHFPRLRYAIASSGAVVYDVHTWEKLVSNELPPELVEHIFRVGETLDCFPFMGMDGQSLYEGPMAPLAVEYGLENYLYEMYNFATPVEHLFDWWRTRPGPVESISFYFRDHGPCATVRDALKDLPLYMSFPQEPCVEMSRNTADKGAALTALCAHLGIPMAQTLVIGDSDNDLPMFRAAGFAVAVDNASEAVKAAADAVTFDCDHDGVGAAIEKYILQS